VGWPRSPDAEARGWLTGWLNIGGKVQEVVTRRDTILQKSMV